MKIVYGLLAHNRFEFLSPVACQGVMAHRCFDASNGALAASIVGAVRVSISDPLPLGVAKSGFLRFSFPAHDLTIGRVQTHVPLVTQAIDALDRIDSGAFAALILLAVPVSTEGDSNQRRQILHLIVKMIALSPNGIHLVVHRQALVRRLGGSTTMDDNPSTNTAATDDPQPFVIERKIAIKRRGVEARLVIDGPADNEPDSPLVNLVARAHYYLARLCDGSASSIAELAEELAIHRADISRILPLAFLSPAITDAILTGRQPADLTSRTLARRADIPFLWSSQATALGM